MYKYLYAVVFLLLLFVVPLHAQQDANAYRSLSDYIAGRSETVNKVSLKEVKNDWGDIVEGYYKVTAKGKEQNLFLRERCWALQAGDDLYLNDFVLTGGKGYSRILYNSEQYLFFNAPLGAGIQNIEGVTTNAEDVAMSGALFGTPGAVIASSAASKAIYHHILDMETGAVFVLNKARMLAILKTHKALIEQYLQELQPELGVTYMKYLSLLNKTQR